ncbi:acyltransferase [Geofilum rubicundum]|uniref:Maltose O-acetyltransferase n=1 Tax=Geofilum rubicundum JCM 15548 TaxID=1236989 RepID=A0A0E9LUA9_9BACT|nr:acyltransferase [Geofilum rubicundum]GAO28726.1 maltose O-acetyltransferase [Geofilum rubicundum JCM 15548]
MQLIKNMVTFLDQTLCRWLVRIVYPQYQRPRTGYLKHYQVLGQYFFMQKVMGFNRRVPWPVDFRSKIRGWECIEKGIMCDPGDNPGLYINAYGGLKMGDNVGIASNTVVVTTNHDKYDHRKTGKKKGIIIGNNVWIGANCTLLPGTIIGNEVTIGAGCVISGEIPSKSTVVRGDNHLKIIPKQKDYQWDIYSEELT